MYNLWSCSLSYFHGFQYFEIVVVENSVNVFQTRDALRSIATLKPEIGVELSKMDVVGFFSCKKIRFPTLQRPSALTSLRHQAGTSQKDTQGPWEQ